MNECTITARAWVSCRRCYNTFPPSELVTHGVCSKYIYIYHDWQAGFPYKIIKVAFLRLKCAVPTPDLPYKPARPEERPIVSRKQVSARLCGLLRLRRDARDSRATARPDRCHVRVSLRCQPIEVGNKPLSDLVSDASLAPGTVSKLLPRPTKLICFDTSHTVASRRRSPI
jgi:hypothetical protein